MRETLKKMGRRYDVIFLKWHRWCCSDLGISGTEWSTPTCTPTSRTLPLSLFHSLRGFWLGLSPSFLSFSPTFSLFLLISFSPSISSLSSISFSLKWVLLPTISLRSMGAKWPGRVWPVREHTTPAIRKGRSVPDASVLDALANMSSIGSLGGRGFKPFRLRRVMTPLRRSGVCSPMCPAMSPRRYPASLPRCLPPPRPRQPICHHVLPRVSLARLRSRDTFRPSSLSPRKFPRPLPMRLLGLSLRVTEEANALPTNRSKSPRNSQVKSHLRPLRDSSKTLNQSDVPVKRRSTMAITADRGTPTTWGDSHHILTFLRLIILVFRKISASFTIWFLREKGSWWTLIVHRKTKVNLSFRQLIWNEWQYSSLGSSPLRFSPLRSDQKPGESDLWFFWSIFWLFLFLKKALSRSSSADCQASPSERRASWEENTRRPSWEDKSIHLKGDSFFKSFFVLEVEMKINVV